MIRPIFALALLLCGHALSLPQTSADDVVRIGSKAFTESVILGEMLTAVASCKQIQGDQTYRVKHLGTWRHADLVEIARQR